MVFEPAEIHARKCFRVETGLRAVDEVERHGVFNVVDRFHAWTSEPEAYEIFAGPEKNVSQNKRGSRRLTSLQANEFALLRRIDVDHAIAIGIVKDHSEIGRREVQFALEFEIDGQVAAGERYIGWLAGRIGRLDGNGSDTRLASALSGPVRQIGAVGGIQELPTVAGGGFGARAVKVDNAAIEDNAPRAQRIHRTHIVADEEDGAAGAGDFLHFAEAFLLEGGVADGEDFVDEEDFGFEMGGDGEGEAHAHAAAVMLERRVDEALDFGKGDDLVEFADDFGFAHAEDGSAEEDVFAAGELRMEAGADFEKAGDAAVEFGVSHGGAGDAREQLEQRGFAGAVSADQADDFALLDFEGNVADGPDDFAGRAFAVAAKGAGDDVAKKRTLPGALANVVALADTFDADYGVSHCLGHRSGHCSGHCSGRCSGHGASGAKAHEKDTWLMSRLKPATHKLFGPFQQAVRPHRQRCSPSSENKSSLSQKPPAPPAQIR